MIDRARLLVDLQRLLKVLAADIRLRLNEQPATAAALDREWQAARDAGRTGEARLDWLAAEIDQAAAHWILACVFVRFLEDNDLIDEPRIAHADREREHDCGECPTMHGMTLEPVTGANGGRPRSRPWRKRRPARPIRPALRHVPIGAGLRWSKGDRITPGGTRHAGTDTATDIAPYAGRV